MSYPNDRKIVDGRICTVRANYTFMFLVAPYTSDDTILTPKEEEDCVGGCRTVTTPTPTLEDGPRRSSRPRRPNVRLAGQECELLPRDKNGG
jgi:hypothetical protein